MGFWDWLNEQNKKAQAANQTANTSRAPQQQQARQQNQQRQAQQRQQQARQRNQQRQNQQQPMTRSQQQASGRQMIENMQRPAAQTSGTQRQELSTRQNLSQQRNIAQNQAAGRQMAESWNQNPYKDNPIEAKDFLDWAQQFTARYIVPDDTQRAYQTQFYEAEKQKRAEKSEADFQRSLRNISDSGDNLFLNATWDSARRGYYQSELGRQFNQAIQTGDVQKARQLEAEINSSFQYQPQGLFQQAVSGASELLGQQVYQWTRPETLAFAGTGASIAAVGGQMGPQVALPEEIITVPTATAAGFMAGSSMMNMEIEAGLAYKEMIDAGVSHETARNIAAGVGGANALLEAVQLDELSKAFGILSGSSRTAKNTVTKQLGKWLLDRGIGTAKETAQEVAQEGVTIAGSNLGRYMEGLPTDTWGGVGGKLGETALSSAMTFGLLEGIGGTTNAISNRTGVNAYAQKQQELAAQVEQAVAQKEQAQIQAQQQAQAQAQQQQAMMEAQAWAETQPPEVQSAVIQAMREGAPPDIAVGLAQMEQQQAQKAELRQAVAWAKTQQPQTQLAFVNAIDQGMAPAAAVEVAQQSEANASRMQQVITEYAQSADDGLVAFAEKVQEMQNSDIAAKLNYRLGDVGAKEALDIKKATGINTDGFTHNLNGSTINHIEARHGANGKQDSSMANIEDLGKIRYVIDNYDSVKLLVDKNGNPVKSSMYKNADGKPANVVRYEKRINGTFYVVEAVPDSAAKKLQIVSAYIQPNKKGAPQVLNVPKSPQPTPKAPLASAPTNNIPSSAKNVNSQNAESEAAPKKAKNPIEIAKTPKSAAETNAPKKRKPAKEKDSTSRTAETLKGYSIFDEKFKKMALDDYGVTSYDRIANPEAMQKANDQLNKEGATAVNAWWATKEASPENIATGIILMNRYQAVGDYESMVATMQHIRELSTKGAQTIQAMSLMGRMTPEGMVYYAQKSLSQAYEEMVKGKNQKWIETNKNKFELNKEDIEFIQKKAEQAAALPEGRDKHILLGEIAARIQNKIPPTAGQSLKALARISMLLNPKTHVRNILGNTIILPQNIVSDFVGAGIDKAVATKTGTRTTGVFKPSALAGMKKGVYESFDDFRRKINTRDMAGDRYEIGQAMNFGNKTKMGRALNAVDRVNSFLLGAEDRPFFEMWFVNSLNNQLKLNDTTTPTATMVDIATTEALQRTWQDSNTYTKFVQQVRNGLNKINIKGYGLGDVILPFVKTPANLTKAVIDYSPINLAKAITYDAVMLNRAIKTDSVTPQMQRQFVKNLSQGISGTLMYVAFVALIENGVLKGGDDNDKDVANFMRNVMGEQPYSVKIGDKTFSYTWAQPVATGAAITADVMNSLKGNGKQYIKSDNEVAGTANAVLSAIQSGGSVLYEQSFLQGLQNLFKADNLVSGLMDSVLGEPAKFTPQLLGQFAQLTDDTQRQTYVYGQPLKTAKNKVLAKIPFASSSLEPVVDTFGREVQRHGGNNNIGNVFFNPANVQSENMNEAGKEVQRLYEATGDARAMPRVAPYYLNETKDYPRHDMSAQERTQYQKIAGQKSEQGILSLLQNEEYQALSDEAKVDALEDVYNDAADAAREFIRSGSAASQDGVNIQDILDGVNAAQEKEAAQKSSSSAATIIPEAAGYSVPKYRGETLEHISAAGVSAQDWAYVEDRLPGADNKVEQLQEWGFTGPQLQGLVEYQVMGEPAKAKLLNATEIGIDRETYLDGYVFGYTTKGTKAQRNEQIAEYVDSLDLTEEQKQKLYNWLKVSKGSGEYSGSSGSKGGRGRGGRGGSGGRSGKKGKSGTSKEASVDFSKALKNIPQIEGDIKLSQGEEFIRYALKQKQTEQPETPGRYSAFYQALLKNAMKKGK